jgi:hypothetical protein
VHGRIRLQDFVEGTSQVTMVITCQPVILIVTSTCVEDFRTKRNDFESDEFIYKYFRHIVQ